MNTFDLTTEYLGLKLRNPFIVSSSGLTSTFEGVKKCEEAGAAAVVLKSIFEEQIASESASLERYNDYPEAADYLAAYTEQNALREYIDLIEKCAKECDIPVIASINCSEVGSWVEYARHFESAGAAAIELNIFTIPSSPSTTSAEVEAHYLSVVEAVMKVVSVPVSVKIPQNFTAPINIVQQLYFRGVKGVTMFNRFYTPDVDLRKVALKSGGVFSTAEELSTILRWVAISSAEVPLVDVAASTGIHSSEAAAKALLCGAKAVEVCTILYKNGVDYLPELVKGLVDWAKGEYFTSVAEFRGKLAVKSERNAVVYERAQFMKHFSTFEG